MNVGYHLHKASEVGPLHTPRQVFAATTKDEEGGCGEANEWEMKKNHPTT